MEAVVSGASRGLGKVISTTLASKGYNLHLIARSLIDLQELKALLEDKYSIKVSVYSCDFSSDFETSSLVDGLSKKVQNLDVLVNNVGVFEMKNLDNTNLDDLRWMNKINLESAFRLTKALLGNFNPSGKPHIFNIGSIITESFREDATAYSISKYALHGFTLALRESCRSKGIKVTEIVPGSINTSSWDGIEDVPKEDFIQPNEIADFILFAMEKTLASNMEQVVIKPMNPDF